MEQEKQQCPHPKEFQECMTRLGFDSEAWGPTPGVTDDATEFYVTLGNKHFHVMSVEESTALSDEDIFARIEQVTGVSIDDMYQYSVDGDAEWQERYGSLEQIVVKKKEEGR